MAEGTPVLPVVNALLMLGILVTTTTMTCSNDRLEGRVLELDAKVRTVIDNQGSSEVDLTPVLDEMDTLRAEIASRSIAAAPGGTTGGTTPAATSTRREPGTPSPVTATGWGGRRAKVLYVEGAAPDGVLRLRDKPHPQNDHYVARNTAPPAGLNSFITSGGQAARQSKDVLGTLMELDHGNLPNVVPGLATRWEISDDKLTYTYHLRRGVQFADGRPFTAKDVLFTFGVIRDPIVKSDHLKPDFEKIESLTAPDPYTVVAKYKTKDWKGIYAVGFTLRVLNKAWFEEEIPRRAKELEIEKYDVEPGKPGFGEVFNKIRIVCPGPGPYYLADEDDFNDESLTLVQNPFYWGMQVWPERYNFAKLRWVYISDPVAAFEAYRKQRFDVTVVDADRWEDSLRHDPTITGMSKYLEYDHMALDCSFIAWNCRKPPFNDARVRTAMTHLVNRQWILDELERGKGTIAVCKSKRSYPTYSPELVAHPFDPDRALVLLNEAGWKDTDGDGVLDKDGKRFEFDLKVPSSRDWFQRVGDAIKDACDKVGVRMNVAPLEWSTFLEDLNNRRFDAMALYNSWQDPWIDHRDTYHSRGDVPNGNNTPGWHTPELDAMLDEYVGEFDPAKRLEIFHRFNKLYYDAQPETLLVHGSVSVLTNNRFENAQVFDTGLQFWPFWVKPENVIHK